MAHHAIQLRPGSMPSAASPAAPCPLMDQMPGESCRFRWRDHQIHYRALGSGPGLLLVHAPDVGASCVEWRRNMEALAAAFTVYAVDLPGFGLSEAHRRAYTGGLYVQFLTDFLHGIVGGHARAVGSGLGASYLVHVTDQRPALIDRLLLVTPAGLSVYRSHPLGEVAFLLMGMPGLSSVLLNAETSRYSIQEHLHHEVYVDGSVAGAQVVEARHWTCHRPNADYVERSRMAGLLNSDIRAAVGRLRRPVMVCWGSHAGKPPLSDVEEFRERCPHAYTMVFERSALAPHEEEPGRFNQTALGFLQIEAIPEAA